MMDESDFDKFNIYAQSEKYTMYTNDMTDIFNTYLQSRDDLKKYRVFVARINNTLNAEYVIVDENNTPIYINRLMENIETYINYELGGCNDVKMSYLPKLPADNDDNQ